MRWSGDFSEPGLSGLTFPFTGVNVYRVVSRPHAGYELDALWKGVDQWAVETFEAVPMPQQANCTVVLPSWLHALDEIRGVQCVHDLLWRLGQHIQYIEILVLTRTSATPLKSESHSC